MISLFRLLRLRLKSVDTCFSSQRPEWIIQNAQDLSDYLEHHKKSHSLGRISLRTAKRIGYIGAESEEGGMSFSSGTTRRRATFFYPFYCSRASGVIEGDKARLRNSKKSFLRSSRKIREPDTTVSLVATATLYITHQSGFFSYWKMVDLASMRRSLEGDQSFKIDDEVQLFSSFNQLLASSSGCKYCYDKLQHS